MEEKEVQHRLIVNQKEHKPHAVDLFLFTDSLLISKDMGEKGYFVVDFVRFFSSITQQKIKIKENSERTTLYVSNPRSTQIHALTFAFPALCNAFYNKVSCSFWEIMFSFHLFLLQDVRGNRKLAKESRD